jgi:hypothetical protein
MSMGHFSGAATVSDLDPLLRQKQAAHAEHGEAAEQQAAHAARGLDVFRDVLRQAADMQPTTPAELQEAIERVVAEDPTLTSSGETLDDFRNRIHAIARAAEWSRPTRLQIVSYTDCIRGGYHWPFGTLDAGIVSGHAAGRAIVFCTPAGERYGVNGPAMQLLDLPIVRQIANGSVTYLIDVGFELADAASQEEQRSPRPEPS